MEVLAKNAYVQHYLRKMYDAEQHVGYTLDANDDIILWSPSLGLRPSEEEVASGILSAYKDDKIAEVNYCADQVRSKFMAQGQYTFIEYQIAEHDASDYINSDRKTIPNSLSDYSAITFQSAEEAALQIIGRSASFKQALVDIRNRRILTNKAIKEAVNQEQVFAAVSTGKEALVALGEQA